MASEMNADHKAAEQARPTPAALPHRSGIATKAPPLARIKIRFSGIPAEEKDKLLFELFDMLLRNNNPPRHLSPTDLVFGSKECKVKAKARIPLK